MLSVMNAHQPLAEGYTSRKQIAKVAELLIVLNNCVKKALFDYFFFIDDLRFLFRKAMSTYFIFFFVNSRRNCQISIS